MSNNSVNSTTTTILVDKECTQLQSQEVLYKEEMYFCLFVCTFIVWLKFLVTTMILAYKSGKTRNRTKEDLKKEDEENDIIPIEAKESEQRWWYIELNDLENFPFHLILFWGAGIVSNSNSSRLSIIVLFPSYIILRLLHTISFGMANFPLRVISFTLCLLCMIYVGVLGSLDSYAAIRKNKI